MTEPIEAFVIYGCSYSPGEPLKFRNKAHLLNHVREPWNYPAIGEEQHGRSFWPCHGDWNDDSFVAYTPDSEIVLAYRNEKLRWIE